MTKWTPKLEALIREVGEYIDKHMKDFLNPKSSVTGSAIRVVFRSVTGIPAMKKACKEANIEFTKLWSKDLKALADLADQNGSNAADKIKKALPYIQQCENDPDNQKLFKSIKNAKQRGIQY